MGYVNVTAPFCGGVNRHPRTLPVMQLPTALSPVVLPVTLIEVILPAVPIVNLMTTLPFRLGFTFRRRS